MHLHVPICFYVLTDSLWHFRQGGVINPMQSCQCCVIWNKDFNGGQWPYTDFRRWMRKHPDSTKSPYNVYLLVILCTKCNFRLSSTLTFFERRHLILSLLLFNVKPSIFWFIYIVTAVVQFPNSYIPAARHPRNGQLGVSNAPSVCRHGHRGFMVNMLAIREPTCDDSMPGIAPGSSDPQSTPLHLFHRGGKECTEGFTFVLLPSLHTDSETYKYDSDWNSV